LACDSASAIQTARQSLRRSCSENSARSSGRPYRQEYGDACRDFASDVGREQFDHPARIVDLPGHDRLEAAHGRRIAVPRAALADALGKRAQRALAPLVPSGQIAAVGPGEFPNET
jgi:hypothetical protein